MRNKEPVLNIGILFHVFKSFNALSDNINLKSVTTFDFKHWNDHQEMQWKRTS